MTYFLPNHSTSLVHFVANLPNKPYCSTDLSRLTIRPAKLALNYAYIQPNDPYNVFWIVFDVDLGSQSFHQFEDKDTATPNLIVQNPENLNCHYLYLLKKPVWVKNTGRQAPQAYLNAIKNAMTRQLSADHRYSGLICKNPLNKQWRASELNTHPYDLDEIAKHLDLSLPSIEWDRAKAEQGLNNAVINGRNDHLFTVLRLYAYERITKYRNLTEALGHSKAFAMWDVAIAHEANRINSAFPTSLSLSELKSTTKSVSHWVWEHYQPKELFQRGKMGFGETRHTNIEFPKLTKEERKNRQSLAAQLTNKQRKETTELKIKLAIETLKANDKKITKSAVAKITGLARSGIKQNYSHLFV